MFCYYNMRLTGKHTPLRYRGRTRCLGSGIGWGRPPHASAQCYLGGFVLEKLTNTHRDYQNWEAYFSVLWFSPYSHLLPPLLPLPSHHYGWATQRKSHPQAEDRNSSSVWRGKEGMNGVYEDGKTRVWAYRERTNTVQTRSLGGVKSYCLRSKQGCMQKLASAGSLVPCQWYWVSQANHCRYLRLLETFGFYTRFDSSSYITIKYMH